MKRISLLISCTLALSLAAGCNKVNMKQFSQPKETATIVRTESLRPAEGDPAQCGTPYDENDNYPNSTEYRDQYGNTLLKTWHHPGGEVYMYARYYYYNAPAGDIDKVVQYEPGKEPRTAKFLRDEGGVLTGISETLILPDRVFEKTEFQKDASQPKVTTEINQAGPATSTTTSVREPLDGGKVQIQYQKERADSVSEVGSKIYDQNSGNIIQQNATRYEDGKVTMQYGKHYTYTPDGKIATIVSHEGAATGYYKWEYDQMGNWTHYEYYREPDSGKGVWSQDKAYTYNDKGDWTRCDISTCGQPEGIILRTFEYDIK